MGRFLAVLLLAVAGCGWRSSSAAPPQAQPLVQQALCDAHRADLGPADRLLAAQRALTLLGDEGDSRLRSMAFSAVSWLHYVGGRRQPAEQASAIAVDLARATGDASSVHMAVTVRGALALDAGDVTAALAHYGEALRLAQQLDNQDYIASASNNLGLLARARGVLHQATEYFEQALAAASRAGDVSLEATISNNLGRIALDLGMAGEALQRYRQMLSCATRGGLADLQFMGRRGVASARLELGEGDAAVVELRTLAADPTEDALPTQRAAVHRDLARAELAVGNPHAAVVAARRAVELFEAAGAPSRAHEARAGLARALAADQRHGEAMAVVDDGLARVGEDEHSHHAMLRAKVEVLAAAGDLAAAFRASETADQLQASLSADRAREHVAFLRARMDSANEVQALRRQQDLFRDRVRLERWAAAALIAVLVMALAGGWLLRRAGVRRRVAEMESARVREMLERDVELRHVLEQQVAQRQQELLHEVCQRQELQRRLEQNRKLEAIGELTGGIAHDFNNLMTVVLSAMDLLRSECGERLHEGDLRLIGDATRAAESGAAITERLLSFARRQALQPAPLRVPDYLDQVRGLLQRTVGDGIEVRTTCADPDSVVFVDGNLLTTALINLAANARDSMAEHGRLAIDVRREAIAAAPDGGDAGGDRLAFAVTDTGAGMDELELARACEPFYTTKADGSGSGLGLSMVYGFARQSGGDLRLVSTPGVGTTVTLLLPVSTVEQAASPPRHQQRPCFHGRTVLVVDDHGDLRALLQRRLRRLGFTVESAGSVADAQQKLQHGRFELVLSDIVMPGASGGLDLARWLRAESPQVRVVLMTGHADPGSALPAGVEVLRKPFRDEELADVLAAALQPAR